MLLMKETLEKLKRDLRKLETAAAFASLNLRINWDTEKPIVQTQNKKLGYERPTLRYYEEMKKHRINSIPYMMNRHNSIPAGANQMMNRYLNSIRREVLYESRGAPPETYYNNWEKRHFKVRKRKVGNTGFKSKSPSKSNSSYSHLFTPKNWAR
jgi:hypothetical protein